MQPVNPHWKPRAEDNLKIKRKIRENTMTTFNYLLSKHILGIFGPLPTYTVLHIYTQLLFWTGNQGNKSWPFWIFLNIIFFFFSPMKISQKLLDQQGWIEILMIILVSSSKQQLHINMQESVRMFLLLKTSKNCHFLTPFSKCLRII